MKDEQLRNPFRSESDAFRLLGIVGAGVAVIVLAAVLGGSWIGLAVAAVVIGAGLRSSYRWLRQMIASDEGGATSE